VRYESIGDIFDSNGQIRQRFTSTVAEMSSAESTRLLPGESWSVAQVAEHIALVNSGIARICAKLLNAAKTSGKLYDGSALASADFVANLRNIADTRLEAPERVRPTGNVALEGSAAKMKDNDIAFGSMRQDLERYDLSEHKFPHPYLGDLTASEWLILSGAHELRHTEQIGRMLALLRR